MNIGTAIVCVNCDNLFEYQNVCPACGATQQLVPLSQWLPAVHKPIMHKRQKPQRTKLPAIVYAIAGGIFAEGVACLLLILR